MMMVSSIHARKLKLHRNLSRNSKRREKLQVLLVNLTLLGALFGYSFFGAAVFMAIEGPNEIEEYKQLKDTRDTFAEWIENLTHSAINEHEHVNVSAFIREAIDKFEEEFSQAACQHHIDRTGKTQWSFYSSLFFSATVISMIGEYKNESHLQNMLYTSLFNHNMLENSTQCTLQSSSKRALYSDSFHFTSSKNNKIYH